MKRIILLGFALALVQQTAQAQQGSVDAEIDALTARVEKLEGTRAVKKLQRAFGYYVDRGLWGEVSDLFAEDGTIEIGIDGVYVGKARIREYLRAPARRTGRPDLRPAQRMDHACSRRSSSRADGRSATARWRDQGMLGQYKKHAEWRDGIYENTYVKEGGVWKIKSLHLYVNFVAPYEKGWARLKPGEGLVQSRGLEGVSAGSRTDGSSYKSVSRYPGAAIPGAQSGDRQAGEGSPLMRATTGHPRMCCLAIVGLVSLSRHRRRMAQGSPEARLAAYRERVARLEDQDAVENLQATFGFYFDKGLWDDAADLFARTGSFEYGLSGVYIGQERIRRAHAAVRSAGPGAGLPEQSHAAAAGDHRCAGWQDRHGALAGAGAIVRARRERHLGRGHLRERVCEGRRRLEDREVPFLPDGLHRL